ncbi:AAA family ATPase [Domibacillus epiphyticus]|uniref:ATP-binding protein n=1 Tax=Domibacillus epiphyticus TaxID=1714355 RepID=A0A1V2A5P0_9BACI|nr:AAA family ATPase [Domibacillus epiphyticus]OMP66182.1 ATP-binding protein [Domibacillus epiphyticus]
MLTRPGLLWKSAAVFLLMAAGVFWYVQKGNESTVIPFSSVEDIIQKEDGHEVRLIEFPDGTLQIYTQNGEFTSYISPGSMVVDRLNETYNIRYEYKKAEPYENWIAIGLIALLVGLGFYFYRKKGGIGVAHSMKNSLSHARPLPDITLQDVGGLSDEMKEDILQTLSILKEKDLSTRLGIEPPRGILLYGPPGTGKTLLAQAIAREIGASFFSSSGSSFTELFVGVGASRVRSLFKEARKQKPAVIFIDEVDALAGRRKTHGGEEGEKTLTELLVQLDGGHDNDGLLFIAATNRKDMLDEAFLRPGRIDFSFHVTLPDAKGRKEIIDIHARGKNLTDNAAAMLHDLAEATVGFSGAELSALFETASRSAIRSGRDTIEKKDFDYALDRTILGTMTRPLADPLTKRRVAIHEAGHALVAALTKPGSVRKATIIPRGQALGYVAPVPKELHLSTASELIDQVAMILSGGVAERLYLGEHSIGVSGDVQQAKQILERMVDTGIFQDRFSLTFRQADKETKMIDLFELALKRSETLIEEHRDAFDRLVEALMTQETLEGIEVEAIIHQL